MATKEAHAPPRKCGLAIKNGKKGKPKVKVWSKKKKSEPEDVVIAKLQARYSHVDPKKVKNFGDFPLSTLTLKGLAENGFAEPTEIQRESIGLSLMGKDILGAAQTGSGKTLAFLIPVLEVLYCKQWTRLDGIGALIITPTRELAYQIFETLRKIGSYHDFSAGLIIGGKDLKFESARMDQCNIVICTPGRLLQHMDENPRFDCVSLQILVLDEADRCLDLGFQQSMNSIIENLPLKRQTLLFSATQTKSVRDLARLSLKDPMYVSVHEHAKHSTPESLAQSYLVCKLEDKLAVLYSFIRNHLKHKVLVFMSSCKQVKYIYEAFCHLRPGISLLALYGSLHQMRRMAIYEEFCRKSKVVMFATDIAARGLDFPAVNWVVQLDCPEDAETYIHRAGRTARFQRGGESLLILMPSEREAMLKRLSEHKIPIKEIKVNPAKLQNPSAKLESNLARFPSLKESAQRAYVSYFKSVFLMRDKDVFNVHALNTEAYAKSLGLAIPPRIRFLQRQQKQSDRQSRESIRKQNCSLEEEDTMKQTVYHSDDDSEDSNIPRNQNINPLDSKQHKAEFDFGSDDSDDDILKMKRLNHELEDELPALTKEELQKSESRGKSKPLTKAAVAKKLLKKKIQANSKVIFDEEGEAVIDPKSQKFSALAREYDAEDVGGIDIEKAKQVLKEEDRYDKQRFREKIKAKHREEKLKAKKKANEDIDDERDDFDSESEDSGPDLSWLPDFDKIYGKQKGSDEGESSDKAVSADDDGSSSYGQTHKLKSEESSEDSSIAENAMKEAERPKRKIKLHTTKKQKKARLAEDEDLAPLDTGLSLQDDEELALRFLRGGK